MSLERRVGFNKKRGLSSLPFPSLTLGILPPWPEICGEPNGYSIDGTS